MSNIVTDKIKPDEASADKLTIGGTGDSVVVLDSLNLNTLQDAGGNNIFVSNGSGTITSKNSAMSGALNLISTQTASGSASLSFTSGLDSTYDAYCFKFIEINPATDNSDFTFNGSTDGGSNYNVTKTTTYFEAVYDVSDDSSSLSYGASYDLAQSTSYQILGRDLGNGADENLAGELWLFAPSSTTYVKHFYTTTQYHHYYGDNQTNNTYVAGYFNSTSAVNAISFKMDSGNFDGVIKLYGISKS